MCRIFRLPLTISGWTVYANTVVWLWRFFRVTATGVSGDEAPAWLERGGVYVVANILGAVNTVLTGTKRR